MEEHQPKLPQTKEEYAQYLISQVKSELRKSPFVLNVFFGFTLMCVEEFTEREFACPCDTGWNSLFAAVYLVVPAVLVLLLMISIKCFQNRMDLKEHVASCASIFGPAIFWIIIVLWDGQTLACALTTWSGSYEDLDDAAPQKWCEPANLTSSQQSEYKAKTQRWFFMSQAIGLGLIITITAFFIVYLICKGLWEGCGKCCRNKAKRDPDTPLQDI
ncbi:uncharacterized protein LOC126408183 [Epinephelus moara]|uniref:uncharacterized protein LOC126408183 n=1 Tax=Epinephelus moara TaxID=300413 RepID=UPI00214E4FD9|nr:uncharacterized protein LOC126408183 [Epinephelus moara]